MIKCHNCDGGQTERGTTTAIAFLFLKIFIVILMFNRYERFKPKVQFISFQ